jgi:hypothetical protein
MYITTDTADHGTATHSQKVSGECPIFISLILTHNSTVRSRSCNEYLSFKMKAYYKFHYKKTSLYSANTLLFWLHILTVDLYKL